MKNAELRRALRLKIGQKLAEVGRRSINLSELAIVLGVTERTLRSWRKSSASKKVGRPSKSEAALGRAREQVFKLMKQHGAPGWRPIAAGLRGEVPVRLVQRFVAEYKLAERTIPKERRQTQVLGKNVIWSLDGAFTKSAESKIENQVVKDRASKAWVGHASSLRASLGDDVVKLLASTEKTGLPLVLSTDNGAVYKSKGLCSYLKMHKVIHLKSLPRTPQHNGAVEVGIGELRQIMDATGDDLESALKVANGRLRRYGKSWSSANEFYENAVVVYNEKDRAELYEVCEKRLSLLAEQPLSFRQRRLQEREIIFEELERRGYLKRWKTTKNG